ncbi:MAG: hypothetical protein FRX49_10894 [Trebouxia sp. A1-2]|nr:MAG: hypothetical protein FRX49_10894 [Trebouxia sp. A1-2]
MLVINGAPDSRRMTEAVNNMLNTMHDNRAASLALSVQANLRLMLTGSCGSAKLHQTIPASKKQQVVHCPSTAGWVPSAALHTCVILVFGPPMMSTRMLEGSKLLFNRRVGCKEVAKLQSYRYKQELRSNRLINRPSASASKRTEVSTVQLLFIWEYLCYVQLQETKQALAIPTNKAPSRCKRGHSA